jgi:hypothetical protein
VYGGCVMMIGWVKCKNFPVHTSFFFFLKKKENSCKLCFLFLFHFKAEVLLN